MSPRIRPTGRGPGLPHRALLASLGAAALLLAAPAIAGVTAITASHVRGQTFITWTNPAGTGWTYRVYVSTFPFQSGRDFADATLLGTVGDSSAMNRRLTSLLGTIERYRLDSLSSPLPMSRGLFVTTTVTGHKRYYAVTTQASGGPEQRTVLPGDNTITSPVIESVGSPRPIWQRAITSPSGDVYALWTTNQATPTYAAMCNQPSRAYLCGVQRGGVGGPLIMHGHGRGGSFLNSLVGASLPGQWVVSIDDYVDSGDLSTFYFGYHEQYDIDHGPGLPPVSGMVRDYTEQRAMHLLRWARGEFPVDTNRVYTMGVSMGGCFAMLFAWHHPELIAAAWAEVPRISLGYIPDSSPVVRSSLDRLWGTVPTGLPCTNGEAVFNWIDGRAQAAEREPLGGAPIVAFSGRNDVVVGWPEIVSYYDAIRAHRAGGAYYWDSRDHESSATAAWAPWQSPSVLGRFRLDRSYPSFSACAADDDPGLGTAATGDSLGTINGALDWNDAVIDFPTVWEASLNTRALTTRWGTIPAPESTTASVTPRRVQQFPFLPGGVYAWQALRLPARTPVAGGFVGPDAMGVVTVPAVPIYRTGTALRITPTAFAGAPAVGSDDLRLSLGANPVRRATSVQVSWPGEGPARLELFDVGGRRARTLFSGFAAAGPATIRLEPSGLAPGVYLLVARQGDSRANRRFVIVP